MARSASSRVSTVRTEEKPNRRQRTIPKTRDDGEERQLNTEEEEEEVLPPEEEEVEELPETDVATPPAAAPKRRGRQPGQKNAAKPTGQVATAGSKLQGLASAAEMVLGFSKTYEMHPVDVLNGIETLLKLSGDIDP